MRGVAYALVLAACGRIGFDPGERVEGDAAPTVCLAPVGHDEDGDGVDDACDVCPQIADAAQLDGDGDTVGDACDPNPGKPGDRLVFFDPFTVQRSEWIFSGLAPTYTGDSAAADARTGQFRADLIGAPANDTYTAVLRIKDGQAGQRQIALYAIEDNFKLYFCDLDQFTPSDFTWQLVFTLDGVDYDQIVGTPAVGPVENRDLLVTLAHTTAGTFACETTWPVDQGRLEGAIPAGITPIGATVSMIGIDFELLSFSHVSSN